MPPGPLILERYVAIDHACGWPNLTLLPGGDLAVLVWPEPCHGHWEGAAECWGSADGGRTWQKRGVPVPHAPGTNRINFAAGLARDEALVAIVSGWSGRPPRGTRAGHEGHHTLKPIPARSQDGGRTWENFPALTAPVEEIQPASTGQPRYPTPDGGPRLTPFGDIHVLPDGSLGSLLYSDRVHFYTSADDGRTWIPRGTLGQVDRHNESTWLPLPDGRLLAAVRTYGEQRLELFASADLGRTWNFVQPLTSRHEHPASLLRLHDGSLLLTYGIRTEALYGIGAKRSCDGGATWSDPVVLVDLEGSNNSLDSFLLHPDGGYPATVQLEDGLLVTAYYSKGVPAHRRYHVGVIRWNWA